MRSLAKDLGIEQLSIAERILLVEEIWDGIAVESNQLEVPQSHKDELDKRLEARQQSPNAASPWSEVKERLQKKL